jgi:hypothetical protein
MAYFIFTKDSDNLEGTCYQIAENISDLNNLNIDQSNYKIIEDSIDNFNAVKYGTKDIVSYNGNIITFKSITSVYKTKQDLKGYIDEVIRFTSNFLKNNINHPQFNQFNNYSNQLKNLNLDNITYPLNISLEQYFKDQNQPSFHTLQIP